MRVSRNFNAESKIILEYSLSGEFICTHNSMWDATSSNTFVSEGVKRDFTRGLKKCCEGKQMHCWERIYIYHENKFITDPEDPRSLQYKLRNRVHQFTIDGTFVADYNLPHIAEDATGVNKKVIANCASGRAKRNSGGGFIWLYQRNLHTLKDRMKQYEVGLTKSAKTIIRTKSKPVVCLTLNGDYVTTYTSLSEAERQTGNQKSNIKRVCQGKKITAGGFKWIMEEDYLKNIQQ